jgi:hypothetical protein
MLCRSGCLEDWPLRHRTPRTRCRKRGRRPGQSECNEWLICFHRCISMQKFQAKCIIAVRSIPGSNAARTNDSWARKAHCTVLKPSNVSHSARRQSIGANMHGRTHTQIRTKPDVGCILQTNQTQSTLANGACRKSKNPIKCTKNRTGSPRDALCSVFARVLHLDACV